MKKSILLIFIFMISFSCSHRESKKIISRGIASNTIISYSIDDILTFKKSSNFDEHQNFVKRLKVITNKLDINIEFKYNRLLDENTSYLIKAIYNQDIPYIEINYSTWAEKDKDAFQEVFLFLTNVTSRRFKNSNSFFELYFNALNSHADSLKTLSKIRRDAFVFTDDINVYDHDFFISNAEKKIYWDAIISNLNTQVLLENTSLKIKNQQHRAHLKTLDSLTQDKQINHLVAQNDRMGVYNLLNTYLPWDKLTPFENVFWKRYLQSIIEPSTKYNTIILYKPIQSELVSKSDKGHYAITGLLSNEQGSWNSRLKQLELMNQKHIGIDGIHQTDEFSRSARISNMFNRHSLNDAHSPFMTLTDNIENAFDVSSEKIMLVAVKASAVFYNYNSDYPEENQYLYPLFIFPDEVISFFDKNDHAAIKDTFYMERISYIDNFLKESKKIEHSSITKSSVLDRNITELLKLNIKEIDTSKRVPANK